MTFERGMRVKTKYGTGTINTHMFYPGQTYASIRFKDGYRIILLNELIFNNDW